MFLSHSPPQSVLHTVVSNLIYNISHPTSLLQETFGGCPLTQSKIQSPNSDSQPLQHLLQTGFSTLAPTIHSTHSKTIDLCPSSSRKSMLLPQALCTCCMLDLECSAWDIRMAHPLKSFRSLLNLPSQTNWPGLHSSFYFLTLLYSLFPITTEFLWTYLFPCCGREREQTLGEN